MVTDATVFGLGILVSIVLTRSLGPEQRGVYALLVTTNVLLGSVAHFSLGAAFSTMLARARYRLGEVNSVGALMALAMGAVCTATVALAFPLMSDSIFANVPYAYGLVAAALVVATIYQMYWNAMMIGLNRILLLNKLNLAVNVTSAVLMVFVVGVLQAGIPGFLAVWSSTALGGALAAFALAWRIEAAVWPPNRSAFRDLLGFGLRTHGANIAHQLFLRFDMYVVNALVGTVWVGFYSLSTSLAEKLWIPFNSLQASSASKIAQLPKSEAALLTAKVSRTSVLMMLAVAIPFGAVSPWLVPFLYGAEFSASVLPLVVLLGGTLGFAVMIVLNNYILGQMQRPGLLSIISWLELAVSIPLYVWLILWQGIVGAAIASTLTYLLAMSATLWVVVRDSGLPVHMMLLPRRSDFGDYARVIRSAIRRLPVLGRYADRPS